MANEGVENRDTSDNDDDDDACTRDDEEEEQESEYDSPDEIYNFLNNCFRCKLIKYYSITLNIKNDIFLKSKI